MLGFSVAPINVTKQLAVAYSPVGIITASELQQVFDSSGKPEKLLDKKQRIIQTTNKRFAPPKESRQPGN